MSDEVRILMNHSIHSATSLNKLIVEPYGKEALKAEVKNGFAHLSQKINSKGLTVLADAYLTVGNQTFFISKGSTAYIKEEILHTAAWATKAQQSDVIGTFLVVDPMHIDYLVPPKG